MEKIKYVRTEVLELHRVMKMCVENNFYTEGDNVEYRNMFEMCKKSTGNIDDLVAIATDIFEHSNLDEFAALGFLTDYECIAHIIRLLIEECTHYGVVTLRVEEV